MLNKLYCLQNETFDGFDAILVRLTILEYCLLVDLLVYF